MSSGGLIDARTAAAQLRISLSTLYSYVSRGKLGRIEGVDGSLFSAQEVANFARRRDRGRRPENVARASLDFGHAVLVSEISSIRDGRLFFRAQDAVAFSENATLENAAALLWDERETGLGSTVNDVDVLNRGRESFLECLAQWLVTRAAVASRQEARPADMVSSDAHLILRTAVRIAAEAPGCVGEAHQILAHRFGLDGGRADLLRRALVLHADHELNTSTFAVRCVASTMASPYAAVLAGLTATTGSRHADFRRAGDLIQRVFRGESPDRLVADYVARGSAVPGFGHVLYPEGDPRAATLLAGLRALEPSALSPVDTLVAAVQTSTGARPKNDLALAALSYAFGLAPDAAEIVFVVGRTVGWLAHTMEQYRSPTLIRPRADFLS